MQADCVNRMAHRARNIIQSHSIQHDRIVTLEHLFWYQNKFARDLFTRFNKILTSEQTCNRNVATKLTVLEWFNHELRFESRVHLLDHLPQRWREECPGENRAARIARTGPTVALELTNDTRKLVDKRSDHADTVFDLWIVAVMRSSGNVSFRA